MSPAPSWEGEWGRRSRLALSPADTASGPARAPRALRQGDVGAGQLRTALLPAWCHLLPLRSAELWGPHPRGRRVAGLFQVGLLQAILGSWDCPVGVYPGRAQLSGTPREPWEAAGIGEVLGSDRALAGAEGHPGVP